MQMPRYERVSSSLFFLLALAQLTRLLLRWPVSVAGVDVPLWASAVAVVVTLSFGVWGLRAGSTPGQG
jgi:hypothetical protein